METAHIDDALDVLRASKKRWARLPIVEKIRHLDRMKENTVRVARRWVEATVKAKGLSMDNSLAGEEWTGGPFSVLWLLKDLRTSLVRLSSDVAVLDGIEHRSLANGRLALDVYPKTFDEGILFPGITAEVWMQPGVEASNLSDVVATFYQDDDPEGAITAVLGAGNVASIAVMDTVYALFNEGKVAMLKMNPVNDYLGDIFEEVFADLVDDGYVRFVYGGGDVGGYLTGHDAVDAIHVTGSVTTYNTIVYGSGEEGRSNRLSDTRITTKPVAAELGGVTPMIIVPGKWSKRDIRYQAEHILAAKMHNAGFNCVSAQVLVMPDDWDQKDEFLDAVRRVLAEYTGRDAYYPGSRERCEVAIAASENVEVFGSSDPRYLVTGLDARSKDEPWFLDEIFGPVLAVTTLPSPDVQSFLMSAAHFANEYLYGTLNATLLIAPSTQKEHGEGLEAAIDALKYGTVTVNLWSGAAYFMSRCSWGAYPGHSPQDIQSGTGVVHNSLMLDRTEKSVVRGPFAPSPRTFAKGEFHVGPKQVYFPTNRTAHKTGELLIDYAANPSRVNLGKVVVSAVLG